MSKAGKILFIFSFVSLFLLMMFRLVLGGWENFMFVPLGLFLMLFIGGVVKDARFLKEFFTMRTTKHGANMGVLILLSVVGLACLNFLSVRFDKRFDWTSEKLNSLSDQSIKAAQGLKNETSLVLLYRKDNTPDNPEKAVKALAEMYQSVNKSIRFESYNALQRPDLAQKYELNGPFPYVFYATQGERKVKIDPPTEEGVTRALIKLGRDKLKTIYFTRGHGENALDDKNPTGLTVLKDELSVTYDVKGLALFETGNKVPDDAAAVAIIGPKQQFLEPELQAMRDYARRGGKLLIAIDPGFKHNLAQLTKTLGVEFTNEFVLDPRSTTIRQAPTLVLGTTFTRSGDAGEITRAFTASGNNSIALFELASSIKRAPNLPAGLVVEDLIATDAVTISTPELKEQIEAKPNGPHTIAVVASGKVPLSPGGPADAEAKEFSAIIFADSDFLANRLIHNNLNRDLITNSFAWLAKDQDLISIRPKEAKGTKLEFPGGTFAVWNMALILLPFVLLASAFGVWWRRRTA